MDDNIIHFAPRKVVTAVANRVHGMTYVSVEAAKFTRLTMKQMQDLLGIYKVAWNARNGDHETLQMLASMTWNRVPKGADFALKAAFWAFNPFGAYERSVARNMACVIRDALKQRIAPDDFVKKAERDIATAIEHGSL